MELVRKSIAVNLLPNAYLPLIIFTCMHVSTVCVSSVLDQVRFKRAVFEDMHRVCQVSAGQEFGRTGRLATSPFLLR